MAKLACSFSFSLFCTQPVGAEELQPTPAIDPPSSEPASAVATPPAPPAEPAPSVPAEITPAPTPAAEPTPAPAPAEPQLATWEEIGPGVLALDFTLGLSRVSAKSSQYGEGNALAVPFAGLSVQLPLLGLFVLNDFFADKRWRIEDYQRLGAELGFQASDTNGAWMVGGRSKLGIWAGYQIALGIQGLFRVSNAFDLGARFYRGALYDGNWDYVDDGHNGWGTWYLNPRARLGPVYLDYTRSLPSDQRDYHIALNVVEARYVFDAKAGRGLGLRVDFASGGNGAAPPIDIEASHFAARLVYTHASY